MFQSLQNLQNLHDNGLTVIGNWLGFDNVYRLTKNQLLFPFCPNGDQIDPQEIYVQTI